MALERLNAALESLSESVSNFNVGAVAISDFNPLEEQITDVRQILKVQTVHHSFLQAKKNAESISEKPQEDIHTTFGILHEKIAHLKNVNLLITMCLHSYTCSDVMSNNHSSPKLKKQVQGCTRKLYALNDRLNALHASMMGECENEMKLRISRPRSVLEYRQFLKEQEDLRDKKLQETNPKVLKNKRKVEVKLAKINMMKQLMMAMLAAANEAVLQNPFLFEMMKKHRELINIETIIEMARDTSRSDSS